MTTKYEAIDFVSLKTGQGDIVSVYRGEIEKHLHSYKGYKVTELIRVIELAEGALFACQIRLANCEVLEPVELDIALSEIRKLKGE